MADEDPGMRLAPIECPECGEQARGSIEYVAGCAEFEFRDDGTAVYAGHTDIWWDEQKTVYDRKGRMQVVCSQGHAWWADCVETAHQLAAAEAGGADRSVKGRLAWVGD